MWRVYVDLVRSFCVSKSQHQQKRGGRKTTSRHCRISSDYHGRLASSVVVLCTAAGIYFQVGLLLLWTMLV